MIVKKINYKFTECMNTCTIYILSTQKGLCEVFPSPFAVFLIADDRNYVEPDISIICYKDKLDDKGCNGAPDWIIEVASQSTKRIGNQLVLVPFRFVLLVKLWS